MFLDNVLLLKVVSEHNYGDISDVSSGTLSDILTF